MDQQVLMYIGDSQDNISRFSEVKGCLYAVADNYIKADTDMERYANHTKDGSNIIALYQQRSSNIDTAGISFLRRKYPKLYIVLVCESLDQSVIKSYLKAGINDTVSSKVDEEKMVKAISFIGENRSKIFGDNSGSTAESLATHFVLPIWKRSFDIVFSLIALIVLSPLFIITMLAIEIESRGPVIYKAKRVGSNYRIFDFLKFRSMYIDADKQIQKFKQTRNQYASEDVIDESLDTPAQLPDSNVILISDDCVIPENEYAKVRAKEQSNNFVKLENDPRITRVGKIIRKYSIDELPQLINILKGDMSVVGNRPLPLYEAEMLTSDDYVDRFMGPSGLTGLWQVEKRGDSGRMSAEEREKLDIKYAKEFSFLGDIKIILKTFTSFIQKENV